MSQRGCHPPASQLCGSASQGCTGVGGRKRTATKRGGGGGGTRGRRRGEAAPTQSRHKSAASAEQYKQEPKQKAGLDSLGTATRLGRQHPAVHPCSHPKRGTKAVPKQGQRATVEPPQQQWRWRWRTVMHADGITVGGLAGAAVHRLGHLNLVKGPTGGGGKVGAKKVGRAHTQPKQMPGRSATGPPSSTGKG